MEIAAGGNFQAVTNSCLQLIAKLAHVPKIEKIFAVGVWRGDDVCNSIRNRRFRHQDRFFDGGGAIISTGQNRAMQNDHSDEPSFWAPWTESLHPSQGE